MVRRFKLWSMDRNNETEKGAFSCRRKSSWLASGMENLCVIQSSPERLEEKNASVSKFFLEMGDSLYGVKHSWREIEISGNQFPSFKKVLFGIFIVCVKTSTYF